MNNQFVEDGMQTYLSIWLERCQNGIVVGGIEIDKGRLGRLNLSSNTSQIPERPAVHVIHTKDVRIWSHGLNQGGGNSRTRGECECVCAASFQRSKSRFQGLSIGVPRTGVLKALHHGWLSRSS